MKYKIIAFDLDGTLLDDDKKISPETVRIMHEAAAQGTVLVPATGRVYMALPEELKNMDFLRYFILTNGAYVYDRAQDKRLFKAEIPLELALDCMEYMDSLPVIYDCYQDDRGFMTESMYNDAESFLPDQPHMLAMIKNVRTPVPELKAYLKNKGEDVQKLQMLYKKENMDERERQFKLVEETFPQLRATSSVKNNIEINYAGAGKGKALLRLADYLGVDPSETAAFGDGTNDTEMLRAAGCGVAMANAREEVKAAADMLTEDNNSSGVGRGIARLLSLDFTKEK